MISYFYECIKILVVYHENLYAIHMILDKLYATYVINSEYCYDKLNALNNFFEPSMKRLNLLRIEDPLLHCFHLNVQELFDSHNDSSK